MKIAITGKNSYIGNNICKFLNSREHIAHTISVRNDIDNIDFKDIDAIIHCAAIVHKKEYEFKEQYEKVNYNLTVDLAKKAKKMGVKQFVFLSTMAVYVNNVEKISKNTPLKPVTLYGKTKLMAETELNKFADDNFTVTIIRPPMVYGKNCPGNYAKLSNLAKKLPVFPKVNNKKSMVYVVNLAFLITSLIENNIGGTFMPMDNKYTSTSYMVKTINKKIRLSKLLGITINIFKNISIIKKAFGTLYYDESCATKINYIDFEKAIEYTEK